MTYCSLERVCAFYYDPAVRRAVVDRHGAIFYLSSGVNHLRAPSVLLDQAAAELRDRFFIESYPGQGGSLLLLAAIVFELHERLGPEVVAAVTPANLAMTVGATGALTAGFTYLAQHAQVRRALVLGLNYSFFSVMCDRLAIAYATMRSEIAGRILPAAGEVLDRMRAERPDLVVLTQPANPSGEVYSAADLGRIVDCAQERGIWLLFDEVPNMAIPFEPDLPAPWPTGRRRHFPRRLIWINSFSKARSLAGLRAGFVLAEAEVADFVRKHNEATLWSPANVATTALVFDMVLRAVGRRLRHADATLRARALAGAVTRFGHYARLFAPYAEDFSHLEDVWSALSGEVDWDATAASYCAELVDGKSTYETNWRAFQRRLGSKLRDCVQAVHGFNHAVKFDCGLSEWEFCRLAFDATGIDFYTESVFSDRDDMESRDYWVRVSCAVSPSVFARGLERLDTFLGA